MTMVAQSYMSIDRQHRPDFEVVQLCNVHVFTVNLLNESELNGECVCVYIQMHSTQLKSSESPLCLPHEMVHFQFQAVCQRYFQFQFTIYHTILIESGTKRNCQNVWASENQYTKHTKAQRNNHTHTLSRREYEIYTYTIRHHFHLMNE